MNFSLSVLAIDKELFFGEVQSVTLPGVSGEIQVLADHASLISQLKQGNLVIEQSDGATETISIAGGTVEVNSKEVVILVNQ